MAFLEPTGTDEFERLLEKISLHEMEADEFVTVQVSFLMRAGGGKAVHEEPFDTSPHALDALHCVAAYRLSQTTPVHIDEYRTDSDRRGRLVVRPDEVLGIRVRVLPEPEDDERKFNYGS